MMMHAANAKRGTHRAPPQGIALLPLSIAIVLTLALVVYPPILTGASGKADHLAATLALWSMSAGYVRGVGFVPHNVVARYLFSTASCLLTLLLASVLVSRHWM